MEQKQTHIPYGFVTGLAMAILGVIIYVMGVAFNPAMRYVSMIPYVIGIILNAIAYSKANDHYVTYGQVFSSCFKACAIVALVSLGMSFVMMYAFPDFKEQAME